MGDRFWEAEVLLRVAGYGSERAWLRRGRDSAERLSLRITARLRYSPPGVASTRTTSLDGTDGSAIDHELGAMDRRSAVGGEISDKVGHLFGLGSPPD